MKVQIDYMDGSSEWFTNITDLMIDMHDRTVFIKERNGTSKGATEINLDRVYQIKKKNRVIYNQRKGQRK